MTDTRQILTALTLMSLLTAACSPVGILVEEPDADMDLADEGAVEDDMPLDMPDMPTEDLGEDMPDLGDMGAGDMEVDLGDCLTEEGFGEACTPETCDESFEVCGEGLRTCSCELRFSRDDARTEEPALTHQVLFTELVSFTPVVCAEGSSASCQKCDSAIWSELAPANLGRLEPGSLDISRTVQPHGVDELTTTVICGSYSNELKVNVKAPAFHDDAMSLWLRADPDYDANQGFWTTHYPSNPNALRFLQEKQGVSYDTSSPRRLDLDITQGWDPLGNWSIQKPSNDRSGTFIFMLKDSSDNLELTTLLSGCGELLPEEQMSSERYEISIGVDKYSILNYPGKYDEANQWLNLSRFQETIHQHTTRIRLPRYPTDLHILSVTLSENGDLNVHQDGELATDVTYLGGRERIETTVKDSAPYLFTHILGHCFPDIERTFEGAVGEVMIYDRALTNTEREAVEAYLRRKYRLE